MCAHHTTIVKNLKFEVSSNSYFGRGNEGVGRIAQARLDASNTWQSVNGKTVPDYFANQPGCMDICFLVQAQAVNASLANGVSEDSSPGSGANPSELGDGLVLDGGIAQRLFQFQLTGDRRLNLSEDILRQNDGNHD